MDTQSISQTISILVFVAFSCFALYMYGVTRSISIIYYHLDGKLRWLFTVFMIAFSVPMSIAGDTPLMFIACGLIILTGVAADGKRDKQTEILHVVGATGGILMGHLSILLNYGMVTIPALGITGTMLMLGRAFTHKLQWSKAIDNHTYFIEVYHFILIQLAIYIHNL